MRLRGRTDSPTPNDTSEEIVCERDDYADRSLVAEFSLQGVSVRRCFICGAGLHQKINSSDEHIIPQWLLNESGSKNESINLPNSYLGSSPRLWSKSKVDCCFDCNQALSTNLEGRVKKIFNSLKTHRNLSEEERGLLLLWIAKVYYGLGFQGLRFAANPREIHLPSHQKLTNDPFHISALEAIRRCLHEFIRGESSGADELGSIFTFDFSEMHHYQKGYLYGDGHQQMPMAIFGYKGIGIVAYLWGGKKLERMFTQDTLEWTHDANPYKLDVALVAKSKRIKLVKCQILDVASIIAQAGTMYCGTPPPRFSYPIEEHTVERSGVDEVYLPHRKHYLAPIMPESSFFMDIWESHGGSLIEDRTCGDLLYFDENHGCEELLILLKGEGAFRTWADHHLTFKVDAYQRSLEWNGEDPTGCLTDLMNSEKFKFFIQAPPEHDA